jgi:hypothetical protein
MKRKTVGGLDMVWLPGSRWVRLLTPQGEEIEAEALPEKYPSHLAAAAAMERIESRLMDAAGAMA